VRYVKAGIALQYILYEILTFFVIIIDWGLALSWFAWLPVGCYNFHFEHLGIEKCHGGHCKMAPMAKRCLEKM